MPYSQQLKDASLQRPLTTDYRIYSSEEVKRHDKPDDLWMVIYNKVYNLTNFSKIHPGDVEVLFDCGGTDGTEAFEDVGHSDYAYQMLRPYLIGELPQVEQKKYEKIPEFAIPEIDSNPSKEERNLGCIAKPRTKRKTRRKRKLKQQQFSVRIIFLGLLAIISFTLFLYIQRFRWVSI
ncbi:Cytochrome b5 [Candida viswanathii]|uniref:Cytochrome b5 n=1 Tax=Candida viswanathii TaxID=5486 RepID=A0A367YN84_9ASCO|nr:Cytochrome b5 [Candida viswanathii]